MCTSFGAVNGILKSRSPFVRHGKAWPNIRARPGLILLAGFLFLSLGEPFKDDAKVVNVFRHNVYLPLDVILFADRHRYLFLVL